MARRQEESQGHSYTHPHPPTHTGRTGGKAHLHATELAILFELVPELDRRAHLRSRTGSCSACSGTWRAAKGPCSVVSEHLLRLIRNGLDQLLQGAQLGHLAPCVRAPSRQRASAPLARLCGSLPATCEPCHILAELYVVLLDTRDQVLYRTHAGAGAAPASSPWPLIWHAVALSPALQFQQFLAPP